MSGPAKSAAVELRDGVIVYAVSGAKGDTGWSLDTAKVLLVGELTNDRGPFEDDWFILFFTAPDNYLSVSSYAEGCMEFLEALGKHLGAPLLPTLFASADWASNVLWPASLVGRPVFTFTDKHAETRLGKVWEWVTGGPWWNWQELTPEVKGLLGASRA